MTKKLTVEELLEKAKRPARARAMHAYDVSTVYKAITAFEVEV